MSVYVSPRITLAEWQSGEKSDIDVFEDQVAGWIFEQAESLSSSQHSGPAILLLMASFVEAMECYRSGREPAKGESRRFLSFGLGQVFPEVSEPAKSHFIDEIRNALAHEACFRRVQLHQNPELPQFELLETGLLAVDPWRFLDRCRLHFDRYVAALRTSAPIELVTAFNDFMTARKSRWTKQN
jgi:hypothetical protein